MSSSTETFEESNFSPSIWSKRFVTGNEVIDSHYKLIRNGSEIARSSVPHDITTGKYGPNISDAYHVYGTDLAEDSPICVYVHGGYWQGGSAMDHGFPAVQLHQVGYKMVVLNYELCPKITVFEIVQKIVKAMQCLNVQYSKSRYFTFVGHSAGSHLIVCALMQLTKMATNDLDKIQHIFLISGVYDLRQLRHTEINANNMLGLTEENAVQLSPSVAFDFGSWSSLSIAIYVVVAENDSPMFKKQSADFYDKLKVSGVNTSFRLLSVCDHFDIVERLSDDAFELTQMILKTIN